MLSTHHWPCSQVLARHHNASPCRTGVGRRRSLGARTAQNFCPSSGLRGRVQLSTEIPIHRWKYLLIETSCRLTLVDMYTVLPAAALDVRDVPAPLRICPSSSRAIRREPPHLDALSQSDMSIRAGLALSVAAARSVYSGSWLPIGHALQQVIGKCHNAVYGRIPVTSRRICEMAECVLFESGIEVQLSASHQIVRHVSLRPACRPCVDHFAPCVST